MSRPIRQCVEKSPLIETACSQPESVKVVGRVADEVAVRVWYKPCLQHSSGIIRVGLSVFRRVWLVAFREVDGEWSTRQMVLERPVNARCDRALRLNLVLLSSSSIAPRHYACLLASTHRQQHETDVFETNDRSETRPHGSRSCASSQKRAAPTEEKQADVVANMNRRRRRILARVSEPGGTGDLRHRVDRISVDATGSRTFVGMTRTGGETSGSGELMLHFSCV